jgi:hypothetical protein
MINILEEDFEELLSLLKEIEKSTIEVQYNKLFNTIWFENIDELDLYIRGSVTGYLTIARICLTDKHSGNGTKILEIMKQIAKVKGFKGVEIESTSTIAINNFCKKYGFKKYEYAGMEIDGEWYGNYRLDII